MMTDKLIEILESFALPVRLQGSLGEEEAYPNAFFTFFCFQGDEGSFYDDAPARCDWGWWVYFYSTDPVQVATLPVEAKQRLQDAGFHVMGMPIDTSSDEPTHTGKMLSVYYSQY